MNFAIQSLKKLSHFNGKKNSWVGYNVLRKISSQERFHSNILINVCDVTLSVHPHWASCKVSLATVGI